MMRKTGYVKFGLTVFTTVAAILLFYDILFGSRALFGVAGKLIHAVAPVLYGAMIAYLLTPIVNFLEKLMFSQATGKRWKPGPLPAPGARAVSILVTFCLAGVLFYLCLSVLLPELYRSIVQLLGNVENYYHTIYAWVEHLLETNQELEQWAAAQLEAFYLDIDSWLTNTLLPQAQLLMSAVSGGVVSAVLFLKDLLVGVIVSVYLLATKEFCAAQGRKVLCSFVSESDACLILRGGRRANAIFSGFVRGKLLDSLIIGILCFIGCSFFKFPYTPLVSVVVGVTNIIPFFGPFIGAIPSTILILLADPWKALYFAIFVLFLQQLDGNVIGPKILGDKTGLSSLGVIVAILIGGSFFGVAGMFFGVPVCACLNAAVSALVDARLKRRNLPVETEAYAVGVVQRDDAGQKTEEKPSDDGKKGNAP